MALFGAIVVLGFKSYVNHLQGEIYAGLLARDSTEAANSRTLLLVAGRNRVYSRRVVQLSLEKDSLERALKLTPKVRASTTIQFDTVTYEDSVYIDGNIATFHEYKKPYTLDASTEFSDSQAHIKFSIAQDPLHLGVRVECGESKNAVHPASILFEVPSYVRVNVDSVSQSKEVCSPRGAGANTGISRARAYTEIGAVVGGIILIRKYVLPLLGVK